MSQCPASATSGLTNERNSNVTVLYPAMLPIRAELRLDMVDHVDAMQEFPRGASVLFGDGVATKGVLRLD